MKLLLLTRYTRLGASSRLRMLQYVPALSNIGFTLDVLPFFDDKYLERLYAGEQVSFAFTGFVIKRLRDLVRRSKPDILWVQGEAFPWLHWCIERAILPYNIPLVSDYDDALFHRYDLHRRAVVRFLLGDKIDNVMRYSDLVMAGNRYLADRAEAAGASRVEIVPTVVDIEAYSTDRNPPADRRPRIGWIGSPSTWESYCAPMIPLLTSVATKHCAMIRAVGAGITSISHPTLEFLEWSEETEVALIQSMDIGIMPLDDSPWARGKCGYKLIQYMACGVPVIASPVGVNTEIVEHGVNGFLAETKADWAKAIETMLGDEDLRYRMGVAGRRKIEREYSLQVYGPRVAEMLYEVSGIGRSLLK